MIWLSRYIAYTLEDPLFPPPQFAPHTEQVCVSPIHSHTVAIYKESNAERYKERQHNLNVALKNSQFAEPSLCD